MEDRKKGRKAIEGALQRLETQDKLAKSKNPLVLHWGNWCHWSNGSG